MEDLEENNIELKYTIKTEKGEFPPFDIILNLDKETENQNENQNQNNDEEEDVQILQPIFDYKGNTYLFCNTLGPSDVEGYGSVYRATASFYKLNHDGTSLEYVRSKFVPEGIHYPTFYVEQGSRLYIIYSTDSRRLDPLEARSNIALEKIFLHL